MRDNRTRFRYRARLGANYQVNSWATIGLRLRTGNPIKQQDPQLTLGAGNQEGGTLLVGLEKAFFKAKLGHWSFWLGKNSFPFKKSNELFWSDNVYPDGISAQRSLKFGEDHKHQIDVIAAHFIISASGRSLDKDGSFQGLQTNLSLWNKRLALWPSLFRFNNLPDIPDGGHTYLLDYMIFHLGSEFRILRDPKLTLGIDYYQNLEDYSKHPSIASSLADEKTGVALKIALGSLAKKGQWYSSLTLTDLQRFAAVDYQTQNDWARWDYSGFGSPDGRLTNMRGLEFVIAYAIRKNIKVTTKYYAVEQLVANGPFKENGQRIRFDIDIKI